MWKPDKLILTNLGTHVKTEYVFQESNAVMIAGINLDDNENPRSNGSGKSTLGEGLYLAITGDSLRGVRTVKLVRRGEKFFETELYFTNIQTKDTLYICRRFYSNSNPNQLKVLFNGKIPKEVPESSSGKDTVDIKLGNKFIFDKLEIDADDLANYYILSKDTYKPFLFSTDTVMKKVIDRFSNAKIVDPVFVLIKKDITAVDFTLSTYDRELLKLQTKIEGYQEEIEKLKGSDEENLKTQLVKQYKEEILTLTKEIERITLKTKELKSAKDQFEKNSETLNTELESLKSNKELSKIELSKFEVKQKTTKDKISKKETQIEDFTDVKSDMYKKVQGSIECPSCSFEFSLEDPDSDIKELKGLLIEIGEDIKKLENQKEKLGLELQQIKKDSLGYEEEIKSWNKKINEKVDKIDEVKQSLSSNIRETSSLLKSVESTKQRIELLQKKMKEEKEREIVDKTEGIQKSIHETELQVVELQNKIDTEKSKKEVLIEQELRFKKFKTYLANQCISSIEGYTNFYLKRIHSNLQIKISGYKELASGEVKEQISCMVLRDGIEEDELKCFSGGERGEVILCNIFALQKIINFNSEYGGLNLTWADEILESIDYVGMMNIYDAVNQLNQCINIISHVKDTGFENEVFVKKENKVSEIINKSEFLKLLQLTEVLEDAE